MADVLGKHIIFRSSVRKIVTYCRVLSRSAGHKRHLVFSAGKRRLVRKMTVRLYFSLFEVLDNSVSGSMVYCSHAGVAAGVPGARRQRGSEPVAAGLLKDSSGRGQSDLSWIPNRTQSPIIHLFSLLARSRSQ